MKRKSFLLIATAMLLQLAGFSQTNPLVKYLPDDAGMVMSIDVKRLGSKIPAETFRQSFIYREMIKDSNSPFPKIFADPASMGIDLSAGILVALKYQGLDRYERNQPIFHLFIKLSNAETFTKQIEGMFAKSDNEANKIQTYGTDRISISGGKMAAGWNNDVLVITSGYSDEMAKEIERYHGIGLDTGSLAVADSMAKADTTTNMNRDFTGMMERFKKAQRDICFQLLTAKPQNRFSTNQYFIDAMSSEADIRIWSGGTMNPALKQLGPLSGIIEKLQAFGGKNKIGLINFENGKIVVRSRNFPADPIADIYKKYPPTIQNTDLIRRLPAGEVLGLVNMSFNQAMSNEMMLRSGLMQIADSIKNKIPFDLGLLQGAFKSNTMIALLKPGTGQGMKEESKKSFGLIMAFPIADKVKFEKLRSALLPLWDSLKINNEKFQFSEVKSFSAKNNDELLVLSLFPETATAFLNSPATGEIPGWMQAYSNYPMFVTIDFVEIIKTIVDMGPKKGTKEVDKMLSIFDKIIMYGGNYENGSISSTLEFRFTDQSSNSFKLLFELFASMMDKKTGNGQDGVSIDEMKKDTIITEVKITDVRQEEYKNEPPPPPPPAKPVKGKTVPAVIRKN